MRSFGCRGRRIPLWMSLDWKWRVRPESGFGITFDRVYSSPLRRAYNTARLAVGLPMLTGDVPVETGSVTERVSIPKAESQTGIEPEQEIENTVNIIRDARLEELGFGQQEGKNTLEMLKDENLPFRYFKDKYQLSDSPQFDTKESSWTKSSPTNSLEFQAIAYFFGRKLGRDLNVPVGIIGCAYGGSRIEAWMSKASLNKFPASDWKDAAGPGERPGRRLLLNYVSIKPYYIENEEELEQLKSLAFTQ